MRFTTSLQLNKVSTSFLSQQFTTLFMFFICSYFEMSEDESQCPSEVKVKKVLQFSDQEEDEPLDCAQELLQHPTRKFEFSSYIKFCQL